MLNEPQYYGLISALPAIRVDKCVDPPWQALYPLAQAFVSEPELALLRGIYLELEHLPLVLGKIPPQFPYPLQHSPDQLETGDPAALPYLDKAALAKLRELPLPAALAQLQQAWQNWLATFNQPLLNNYLSLRQNINLYRLQWLSAENAEQKALLKGKSLAPMSVLEQQLEQELMPGMLQQLVHSGNSRQQEWQLDQLLFEWLEQQVFHQAFSLNALLSYGLRQQISWKWYVPAGFDSRQKIESLLNEIMA